MKKILSSLIILTSISCNNQRESAIIKGHTEAVLEKADSVLYQHNKIKEENFKVLEQVIEKYSADTLKLKKHKK